jgi:hypothetical protein
MKRLWQRIKNLWRLSSFRIEELTQKNEVHLVKDIPTIKKKLAKIIKPDKEDIFAPLINHAKEIDK